MDLIGEFHPPLSQGNGYAYRFYLVYPDQVEESITCCQGLHAACVLDTRWKHEDTHRQWNRVQK